MAKPLTIKEAKFIEGHQGLMTMKEIAEKLGRSYTCIRGYLVRNGLRTPGAHGGKRTDGIHENLRKKGFKKGNKMSPNVLPIGSITQRVMKGRKIYYIKTESGWSLLSVFLMRAMTERDIQNDEMVIYRDGDPTNCSIENLELVKRIEVINRSMTPAQASLRACKIAESKRKKNPPTLSSTVSGMNQLMFGFDLNRKGA